jgi:hypothetical protein
VQLWDKRDRYGKFPGSAKLKRSPRERPQLRSFGVEPMMSPCCRTGTVKLRGSSQPRSRGCAPVSAYREPHRSSG